MTAQIIQFRTIHIVHWGYDITGTFLIFYRPDILLDLAGNELAFGTMSAKQGRDT